MLNGGVSQFVPTCPVLSPLVLFCPFLGPGAGTNRDKRGQTGTKRHMSGQIGKSPHLASTPLLAILLNRNHWRWMFAPLNRNVSLFKRCRKSQSFAGCGGNSQSQSQRLRDCGALITLRAQRLKKFKILKFSSEIVIFKRATHQTPIFCGEFRRSGLKFSSAIEHFQARLKISSETENFQSLGPRVQSQEKIMNYLNLWALRVEICASPDN